MIAAINGHIDTVAELVRLGADMRATDMVCCARRGLFD
jgi:hypothetical protein